MYYGLQAEGCYIRISMNNLKDIHNEDVDSETLKSVVILGFQ